MNVQEALAGRADDQGCGLARAALRQAHRTRAEAQEALDAARAAADRARKFAVAARDRCNAIEEETRDTAIDRSISIRNAILAGETPRFDDPSPTVTANALAAKELEHRALAAEIAQADLEAQEDEALRASTAAQDQIRKCAEEVLNAEATHLAETIATLEATALSLRVRLGSSMSPIATRGVPIPEVLARVLAESDTMSERFVGERWHAVRACASVWAGYIDKLIADPSAQLEFNAPPEETKAAA